MPEVSKSRFWKLLALFIFVALVLAIAGYFRAPLPPPQIVLSFQGFKTIRTNTYTIISISNAGGSPAWWHAMNWDTLDAEAKTPKGSESRAATSFYQIPVEIRPHRSDVFFVPAYANTPRLRVNVSYTYYPRYRLRYELEERLRHTGSSILFKAFDAFVQFLPEPRGLEGMASTAFSTDQVPVPAAEPAIIAK